MLGSSVLIIAYLSCFLNHTFHLIWCYNCNKYSSLFMFVCIKMMQCLHAYMDPYYILPILVSSHFFLHGSHFVSHIFYKVNFLFERLSIVRVCYIIKTFTIFCMVWYLRSRHEKISKRSCLLVCFFSYGEFFYFDIILLQFLRHYLCNLIY